MLAVLAVVDAEVAVDVLTAVGVVPGGMTVTVLVLVDPQPPNAIANTTKPGPNALPGDAGWWIRIRVSLLWRR